MANTAAPPWPEQADVEEHGATFLWLFQSRAHFEHYKLTGEMARRDAAAFADQLLGKKA